MAKFPLTEMAVNMFCPGNVVQLDDAGLPSVLVYIPAFKNSDVLTGGDDSVHPAFIVNGVQIPGFYYSKYENCVHNGKAYSLPAEDPKEWAYFETARKNCEAKGHGWHLSTAAEWAAIALWCKKNGFLPNGNNTYGKDVKESNYKAITTLRSDDGRTCKTATGTGPMEWSHDGTPSGIWDMNGNLWEWQAGIRLVWGELQILANNDAADPDNPQNETSTCWKAINAADGSLVEPECKTTDTAAKLSGGTVRLDYVSSVWKYTTSITSAVDHHRNCAFGKMTCDTSISESAKVLLRALALLQDSEAVESEYESNIVNWNNGAAERSVARGGAWSNGVSAGVFSIHGLLSRQTSTTDFGFRSAYIPNI